MGLMTLEDLTSQIEAVHASLRSATIIIERLYADLKEAEQGSGPGPSKEATSSRDNCAHNGAQIASGMGEETIRMFCPECQKFLVNGVAED